MASRAVTVKEVFGYGKFIHTTHSTVSLTEFVALHHRWNAAQD
jgi:hypothetical protein